MIRNRAYIAVSIFFILVLILFLIFNPASYSMVADAGAEQSAVIERADVEWKAEPRIAVIVGGEAQSAEAQNIMLTLDALRQGYRLCDSAEDIGEADLTIAVTIGNSDAGVLKAYLEAGGSMIVTSLPDRLSPELLELLGMRSRSRDLMTKGFDIYEGLFTSGWFRAEELSLRCADVRLSGRCRVYADALPLTDEPGLDRIPIIWRTYHESGAIFVMGAPFMKEASGAGVLAGLVALAYGDFIYPAVGVKTVALENFPYVTGEGTVIEGREAFAFMRDIIWPDLVSLAERLELTYTCYTNGGFVINSSSGEMLGYFSSELRLLSRGEMGYGGSAAHAAPDMELFADRSIRSVSGNINLPEVTSYLTRPKAPGFEWAGDSAVKLPVFSEGLEDEAERFACVSALSAYGMMLHSVNMAPLFTEGQSRNDYSRGMREWFWQLFSDTSYLEAASARDAAESVKNYLNTRMESFMEDGRLNVKTWGNSGEAAFVLRTAREVDADGCVGCEATRVNEGAYMIKAVGAEFSIAFKEKKS